MEKKLTLFDTLNAIFYKKDFKYDKKIANSYILSMGLSMDKGLIDIVNKMNKYLFDLPDELVYTYYYKTVPKGRRYLKWTKGGKKDKKKQELIKELAKNHNCSIEEIKKSII